MYQELNLCDKIEDKLELADEGSSSADNKLDQSSKRRQIEGERKDLTKLLEEVDPFLLKKILLDHAKDHRAFTLSYLEESLREESSTISNTADEITEGIFLPSKDEGPIRQWTKEFQQIKNNLSNGSGAQAIKIVAELVSDFVSSAEKYARVIVDELCVADEYKTIKRAHMGGVAGGEKYVAHGILFKFCLDKQIDVQASEWFYGGRERRDDFAMKVGSLEIQGLNCWELEDRWQLEFPMMALIDYKGFRLVASSLLPIGDHTLRYGSSDGGATICADDKNLAQKVAEVARILNLKEHTIGKNKVPIYGPGDLEGHLGLDGKYYLLDFARTMPPEAPEFDAEGYPKVVRGVFYRMLRPELVMENPVPLSSDAFSGWGEHDINKEQSQNEIIEATKRIINEKIPQLVKELLDINIDELSGRFFSEGKVSVKKLTHMLHVVNLSNRMHRLGINLRYLGRVRQQIGHEWYRKLLVSIAMARNAKAVIRDNLRQTLRTHRMSEYSCNHYVASLLNTFFERIRALDQGQYFDVENDVWHTADQLRKSLLEKYPEIVTTEELMLPPHMFGKHKFYPKLTLFIVVKSDLFKLEPGLLNHIITRLGQIDVHLAASDIAELITRVKYPGAFSIVMGLNFQREAKERLARCSEVMSTNTKLRRYYGCNRLVLAPGLGNDVNWELNLDELHIQRWPFLRKVLKRTGKETEKEKTKERKSKIEEEEGKDVLEKERDVGFVHARLKEARRLLKRALRCIETSQGSTYGASPYAMVLAADMFSDLAVAQVEWKKSLRLFLLAYDKLKLGQKIAGPFKMLVVVWAEILYAHSKIAEMHGMDEEAKALKLKSNEKLEELLTTETVIPTILARSFKHVHAS